jgi:hypothetical protein
MNFAWFKAHPTQPAHPPHLQISKLETDLSLLSKTLKKAKENNCVTSHQERSI